MAQSQSLKEISVGDILGKKGGTEESASVRAAIISYVRQNPEGVTIRMVCEAVGVDYHRAYAVMKELVNSREVYSRKVGGIKQDLYYPNGRLIHKYLQHSKDIGDQTFRVSFHEGNRGPRIQVQERRYTLLEGEKVEGSIFIDVEKTDELLSFLQEMLIKFNQSEKK